MSESTADRVRGVVSDHLGVPLERVTDESTLTALGADSLDAIEIEMRIDVETGICMRDTDWVRTAMTVGEILARVEKQNG